MKRHQHTRSVAITIGAIAVLVLAWLIIPRGSNARDSRFDFDADAIRPPTDSLASGAHVPTLSALDPDAVERLRDAIANAVAQTGVDNASAATSPALEYALGVGDGDIDRLLGIAIEHGGKPNDALVARFRNLADAQPDRGRPRDLATWNAVQVFRWSTVLSSTAIWVGVDFDGVSARPFLPSDMDAFFDVTPTSPDVQIGIAPMKFPRPDLHDRLVAGAPALIITIPASLANGDPLIAHLLLVEYEPGAWYPLNARVEVREAPKMPSRAPRPD